jgi:hypothetical protein
VHEPEICKVLAIAALEAESGPAWDKALPTAVAVQEAVAVAVREVVQEVVQEEVQEVEAVAAVAVVTDGYHFPLDVPASTILVGAGDIFIYLFPSSAIHCTAFPVSHLALTPRID